MNKEKIGIVFTTNQNIENEILKTLNDLNVETIKIENENENYKTFYNLAMNIKNKKINRAIIIDDFGTLPFMVIGKIQGMIVAQISDEHSAHMTSEHNGANVICLGTELNSLETIQNIIVKFVNTPFAAGRHLVRTEMLDEMLKKEEVC